MHIYFFIVLFNGSLSVFYGMTVIVTDSTIKVKFGTELSTKKIDLSTVRSVTVQKYAAYSTDIDKASGESTSI